MKMRYRSIPVNSTKVIPYCFAGRELFFRGGFKRGKGVTRAKIICIGCKLAERRQIWGKFGHKMKKRVLIFDDDEAILEVRAIVLETNGFEAVTQNNCEDILKKVEASAPDVILMDNKIPPLGDPGIAQGYWDRRLMIGLMRAALTD
jgi:hypothetical protein